MVRRIYWTYSIRDRCNETDTLFSETDATKSKIFFSAKIFLGFRLKKSEFLMDLFIYFFQNIFFKREGHAQHNIQYLYRTVSDLYRTVSVSLHLCKIEYLKNSQYINRTRVIFKRQPHQYIVNIYKSFIYIQKIIYKCFIYIPKIIYKSFIYNLYY